MAISCPNFNAPKYEGIVERRGERFGYMMAALSESLEFQEWYGLNDLDVEDDLTITNTKGEVRHLDQLFMQYVQLPSDKRDAQALGVWEQPVPINELFPEADLPEIIATSRLTVRQKYINGRLTTVIEGYGQGFQITDRAYGYGADFTLQKALTGVVHYLNVMFSDYEGLQPFYEMHKAAQGAEELYVHPLKDYQGTTPPAIMDFVSRVLENYRYRRMLRAKEVPFPGDPINWEAVDSIARVIEKESSENIGPNAFGLLQGQSATHAIGHLIGWARDNGFGTEARILDAFLQRFATHLSGQTIDFTSELPNSEGMQVFEVDGTGRITVSKALTADNEIFRVLVHEIVHSVTKHLLTSQDLNRAEQAFIDKIKRLFDYAKANATEQHYLKFSMSGLESMEEFIAQLFSNPDFRRAMNSMSQANETLLQKFIRYIKELFGIEITETFNIQELIAEVSEFQQMSDHVLPLHVSYSTARESFDRERMESDAPGVMEETSPEEMAQRILSYYKRLIRELHNSPEFYRLTEIEIEDRIQRINAKAKITQDFIDQNLMEEVYIGFLDFMLPEVRIMEEQLRVDTEMHEAKLGHFLKQLKVMQRYLRLLEELAEVDSSWNSRVTDRRGEIKESLDLISGSLSMVRQGFTDRAIGRLAKLDGVTEYIWSEKFKTEFREENPGKKARTPEERRYVSRKMLENKEKIEDDKQVRIGRSLRYLPRDIHMFLNRIYPYTQSQDPIIALSKLYLDEIVDRARQGYLPIEQEFLELYEDYIVARGGHDSDLREFWSPLLEHDEEGKLTRNILSPYRAGQFEAERRTLWEELEKKKEDELIDDFEESRLKNEFYDKWFERKYVDKWYDLLEQYGYQDNEEAELINKRLREVVGAFKGNNVDPQAFNILDLRQIGKIYAELDEARGEVEGELIKKLKDAGFDPVFEDTAEFTDFKLKLKKWVERGTDDQGKAFTQQDWQDWTDAMQYEKWVTEETRTVEKREGRDVVVVRKQRVKKKVPLKFLKPLRPNDTEGNPAFNARYDNGIYVDQRSGKKMRRIPQQVFKQEHENPEWAAMEARSEDDVVKKMYNFMTKHYSAFDRTRPPSRRLNYRIPGIRKTNYEILAEKEGGFMERVRGAGIDALQVQMDEIGYGDHTIPNVEDLEGELHRYVPIYFTGHPEENMQSYDLASLFLANAEMSIKHAVAVQASPELEGIADLMGTDPTEAGQRIIGSGETLADGRERTVINSNAEKLFRLMLEDKLYGLSRSPKENRDWARVIDTLQQYSSTLYLGANLIASSQNILYGQISSWLETVGGGILDPKALWKAEGYYWRNTGAMISDYWNMKDQSMVNLVVNLFDGNKQFSARRYSYNRNSAWRKLGRSSTLTYAHSGGEHYVQSKVVLAVLGDTLVMDGEGNYLNHNFEVVEDPTQALNLLEALQKNKDGELETDPRIQMIEWRGTVKEWRQQADVLSKSQPAGQRIGENEGLTYLTSSINALNNMIHGAYGHKVAAEMERHWQWRMATQLRKWMLAGFRRHWLVDANKTREYWSTLKDPEQKAHLWDTDLAQEDYGMRLMNEGMYITTARYINGVFRAMFTDSIQLAGQPDIGKGAKITHVYRRLSDYHKSNLWKTVTEASLVFAFSMLYAMIDYFELTEDDDESESDWGGANAMAGIAFQFWRMSQELGLYYSPDKMLNVVKNPAVLLSFILDVQQFGNQVAGDIFGLEMDMYKSGPRRGQPKLLKKASDILPGIRSIHSMFYLKEKLNYQNLNK